MRNLCSKFIVLILFLSPDLYAQTNPHQTVDSLLSKSFQYFLEIDFLNNIKTANKALLISKSSEYSEGKARSYFYLGRAFSYLGEYNKSLEYLQLSEYESHTKKNADIHSEICRIRGQIYMYLGLPTSSLKEFRKELAFVKQIKEVRKRNQLESLAYENLSISYKDIQQYDSMLYYLDENKTILSNSDIPYIQNNLMNLYTLYGEYHSLQKEYDSAHYYFNQALEIANNNSINYTSWIYKNWGDMQLQRGKVDSALILYQYAIDNLERTQIKNEYADIYNKIAQSYTLKGMNDKAKVYQEKAVLVDNELLKAKQEAVEKALTIILKEEREQIRSIFSSRIAMLIYLSIFIVFVGFFNWLHWRNRQRKKLKEKETELEDLESRLNNNVEELIELAKTNDIAFISTFKEKFTKHIYEKHPDLVKSEFWFCAMIFLGFSSKEIAQYSFVEHRSIQIRKSRLRKKLNISSEIDLYMYIKSLDELPGFT